MTPELISKFVENEQLPNKPVKIEFKKRNAVTGMFVKVNDYDELKSKNFWRFRRTPDQTRVSVSLGRTPSQTGEQQMPHWREWKPQDGLQRMLRLKQVQEVVGFKSTQIYEQISKGKFPPPVKVSDRASAWIEGEILDWLAQRAAQRDKAA